MYWKCTGISKSILCGHPGTPSWLTAFRHIFMGTTTHIAVSLQKTNCFQKFSKGPPKFSSQYPCVLTAFENFPKGPPKFSSQYPCVLTAFENFLKGPPKFYFIFLPKMSTQKDITKYILTCLRTLLIQRFLYQKKSLYTKMTASVLPTKRGYPQVCAIDICSAIHEK